jgi:hypothetical protein
MRPGGCGWRCAGRGAGAADLARGTGVVNAVARPEGIEPPTCGFEGRRSIRLSYGRLREAAGAARGNGVSKGARTLNPRIHSPVLYRLSYAHRETCAAVRGPLRAAGAPRLEKARPEGVEPPTRGLEGRCSVHLSYGREGRTPASLLRGPGGAPAIRSTCQRVGAAGFGPATSCAQGRRATRLRYAPEPLGDLPPAPNREGVSSAPTGFCQRVAATCRRRGTSRRIASPRWETASLSAGASSAIVRSGKASGRKSGS